MLVMKVDLPNLSSNEEAIEILLKAIESSEAVSW